VAVLGVIFGSVVQVVQHMCVSWSVMDSVVCRCLGVCGNLTIWLYLCCVFQDVAGSDHHVHIGTVGAWVRCVGFLVCCEVLCHGVGVVCALRMGD